MKNHSTMRLLLGAFAMVVLSGCSYLIEITRTDEGHERPSFQLIQDMPLFFDRPPKVTEVAVYIREEDQWNHDHPAWRIVSAEGVALAKLEYGVVPAGFEVHVPAVPLSTGQEYKLSVHAWGASGEQPFVLDKGSI